MCLKDKTFLALDPYPKLKFRVYFALLTARASFI
jgi:hypothetical protein